MNVILIPQNTFAYSVAQDKSLFLKYVFCCLCSIMIFVLSQLGLYFSLCFWLLSIPWTLFRKVDIFRHELEGINIILFLVLCLQRLALHIHNYDIYLLVVAKTLF